jgi:hypothetical protein
MMMIGSLHRFDLNNCASCSPPVSQHRIFYLIFTVFCHNIVLLLISDSTCRERTSYKKSDYLVMMKSAKLILFI